MKKKYFFIGCALLCLAGLLKGYDKVVDGFYLHRIRAPLTLAKPFSYDPSEEELLILDEALNQPFYYLSSGSQSFVFKSADSQYVLKFFKHYRWKPPFYAAFLPSSKNKTSRENGLIATYQSCYFCMHEFKKESALLYLQLTPSFMHNKTITLHNRLGKKYSLSLGEMTFILQRYAEPTANYLLKLRECHDDEKAREAITALFNNLLKKKEKGFTDKDPNFLNNLGFIGSEVVCIDIGGLTKDPKKDDFYFCNHALNKVSKSLFPWLELYYPELLNHTQITIDNIKSNLRQQKR